MYFCCDIFAVLRNIFLVSCVLLACSALFPVLWHLWIYAGSANSNFYYAITLLFSVAQVPVCLPLSLSALSVCLSVCLPVSFPPFCLSPSLSPSICLLVCVCLTICQSVCPSDSIPPCMSRSLTRSLSLRLPASLTIQPVSPDPAGLRLFLRLPAEGAPPDQRAVP